MLAEKFMIRNAELPTRMVMAPCALEKAEDGRVTEDTLAYYDARTKGGHVGMVVIEHSYIRKDGQASPKQISVASDEMIPGLTRLAETIHKNGSKTVVQINHAGSAIRSKVVECEGISPSGLVNPRTTAAPGVLRETHAAGKEEIEKLICDYVDAAMRVCKAGFDGVEVHSAHGYLLNQFYSPLTNHREDEYGSQSVENRVRLHTEVVKAIKAAVPADFLVGIRLGACDYMEGGSTPEDGVRAGQILEEAGYDFLDISGGLCFYTKDDTKEPGWFSDLTEPIKKAVKTPVILTGGIRTGEDAERLLKEEKTDLIGVGRAILEDAQWADKNVK